jgi:hypothetical protein
MWHIWGIEHHTATQVRSNLVTPNASRELLEHEILSEGRDL